MGLKNSGKLIPNKTLKNTSEKVCIHHYILAKSLKSEY